MANHFLSSSSSSTSDDPLTSISRLAGPKLNSAKEYTSWTILMRNHLVRYQLTDLLEWELKNDKFKLLTDMVKDYEFNINESSWTKIGITKIQPATVPKVKREESASSSSSGTIVKDQIKISTEAEYKTYAVLLKNLRQLYSILYESIYVELRKELGVEGQSNGVFLWKWLKDKLGANHTDFMAGLFRELFEIKQLENELFSSFKARVDEINHRLAQLAFDLPPIMYRFIVLDNLRSEYQSIIMIIKHGESYKENENNRVEVWLKIVSAIENYERIELKRNDGSSDLTESAMSATGKKKNYTAEQLKNMTCFNCHEKGHSKWNCPNPKKERQQQVNGQANSAVASKSIGDNKSSTSNNDTLESFAFLTMGYKSESDDEAMVAAIAAPVSVKSIVPTRPKTPPPITNGPRQLKRLIRPSETIQSTVSDPSITPKIPSVPTANVQRAEVLQSAKVPGPTNLVVGKETYQSIEYLLKTSAWGIDTMASIHCTGNKKLFSTLRSCDALNISVADGGKVVATQWGTIKVRCRTNKASITTLNLTNVYYSPHLGPNLLSAARLVAEHNCELRVNTSGSRLYFTDGTEIPLSSKGKVTTLLGGAPAILYCAISQHGITTIDELVSVHARMNHAGFDRMIKLIELQKTRGLGKLNMSKENIAKARELITNCLACKLGKSTNTPHSGNAKLNHGTRPGEVLHFDTFELSLTNGIHEYGLIVVEPYTGALRAGRLLSKDKIVDHLINIIKQTEVCTQSKVKFLYTDGGTEFINKTLKNYCNE